MNNAAISIGAKLAVAPQRPPQRDAGGEGGAGTAAFGDLLVAVEEIAAVSEQVIAQAALGAAPHQPPRNPGQTGFVAGHVAEGTHAEPVFTGGGPTMGAELASLIAQRAFGQGQGAVQGPKTEESLLQTREGADSPAPELRSRPHKEALRPAEHVSNLVRPLSSTSAEIQQAMNLAARASEDMQQAARARQDAAAPKVESTVAGTSKLEATLQQNATLETSNPVVRQVATNLQYVARGQIERMRVDLHPEELGRVQIQLQKTGGVSRITIITETAQAFEALQRGAGGLQQALGQAGFETDDLRFEHRDGRGESRQQEMEERRERSARDPQEQFEEERREVLIRPARFEDRVIFL